MIYAVIVGLAGALLMFAGDMLLYYTPEESLRMTVGGE